MDLKDMILVTENYKGTEKNMLMTLEDYKKFVSIEDMSELAEHMLLLGRTLARGEGFTEYYRAANVTVFAKFCSDDVELGRFLRGHYNDSEDFVFDKKASSPECIAKMKEIGMTDTGWIDDFIMHYEKRERTFERGQTIHNFNDSDYMVLEALSPRNLVVMDMKRGSIAIALGTTEYERCPKGEKPTKGFILIPCLHRSILRHTKQSMEYRKEWKIFMITERCSRESIILLRLCQRTMIFRLKSRMKF